MPENLHIQHSINTGVELLNSWWKSQMLHDTWIGQCSNGHFAYVWIRHYCKFDWASCTMRQLAASVCVGEHRAEAAHQSDLRTPFPPTSCKCSVSHGGRQESAGSHRVRIQQTYFFLLIWAIAASIDWAKAQCSYRRGGVRSTEGGGLGAVNVAPTGESNAPSCFKRSSTLAAQGNGA